MGTPTHPMLFVYGTLLPGEVRWHLLEPLVDGAGAADVVAGRLFDTGEGFPAAIFAAPADPEAEDDPTSDVGTRDAGEVHGMVFALHEQGLVHALDLLDEIEQTADDQYRRVEVTTRSGVAAWAYERSAASHLRPIGHGSWLGRDR